MILDSIQNLRLYQNVHEYFSLAIDFIERIDLNVIKEGKYEIDGENLFVNVFRYNTKSIEESKLEGHNKYIDIQVMLKGNEKVGYASLKDQKPVEKYNELTDLVYYHEDVSWFDFQENMFCVFFPCDLHQPAVVFDESCEVLKVVCKVKV